jgi:hypothetical protein
MAPAASRTTRYTIDPLKIKEIPHGRTWLFIGKRNAGKSTALRDVLFHRQEYLQFGIALAGSDGAAKAIRSYHPDTFIIDKFDRDYILNFWNYVKKVNGKRLRRNQKMINFYFILDDAGFDASVWKDEILKEMFQNGRQYALDVYACVQYIKSIGPGIRGQIDYAFLFKEKAPENRRKLFETFAGGFFENKTVFEQVFDSCTKSKRAMVVRNCDVKEESGPFDGGIYFYRAKVDLREFTIGCDDMWRHHYKVYNDHYQSDEEEEAFSGAAALPEAPKKRSEIEVTLRKTARGSKAARPKTKKE